MIFISSHKTSPVSLSVMPSHSKSITDDMFIYCLNMTTGLCLCLLKVKLIKFIDREEKFK